MDNIITRTLDNRALLIALDNLYREQMKTYEEDVLLPASRQLVKQLELPIAQVPIEGYYHESAELTEYFLTMRALQACARQHAQVISHMPAYQLLAQISGSPIFGCEAKMGFFPQRLDAIFCALEQTSVAAWSVDVITAKAHTIATAQDDFSLVGLAAFIADAVVLTAVRESTVLYAAVALASAASKPAKIVYQWQVDPALQARVNRFIQEFNRLTQGAIKAAEPANIEYFYHAFSDNELLGRCVCIGKNDSQQPVMYCHWAINHSNGQLKVDEFWSDELWTSERYQSERLWAGY